MGSADSTLLSEEVEEIRKELPQRLGQHDTHTQTTGTTMNRHMAPVGCDSDCA